MAANHLLFFGLLLSLFQTSTCVGTSIDVNPSKLELPDASAANGGTVNITCRAKPGAKRYYILTISRSLNSDNSKKKIVVFDFADKVVTGPFDGVSGSVSSGSDNMSMTLIMKKAKCGDSGRYFCELLFQPKDLSVLIKDSYEDLEVEVIPGEITLTATPSGLTQWVVNETLSMRCNGPVGTVLNSKTVIDWIWEYGKEINNQVASWTRYPDEEDISPGLTTSGDCFENRNSILLRSLQIEDTNRVYRCYVRRNGKSYPELGAKQSVGTVSLERVTTPAGSGGGGGGVSVNMYAESLGHVDRILVITCTSDSADQEIVSVKLFDPQNDSTLVFVGLRTRQCRASAVFSSCDFDLDQHKVTLRAIINDLEEGEMRRYGCQVLRVTSEGSRPTFYYVNVRNTVQSTTTTITPTTKQGVTTPAGSGGGGGGGGGASQSEVGPVVGGVIGAAVVLVPVVIIVIVILLRRRCKQESPDNGNLADRESALNDDYLEPVARAHVPPESSDNRNLADRVSHSSGAEYSEPNFPPEYLELVSGPYDSLRMAEVGVPSVYSSAR